MVHHNLKTWPLYYENVRLGIKLFEIRMDDRGFETGDILTLHEWNPVEERYTGRNLDVNVVYCFRGIGLLPGYVAMSIKTRWVMKGNAMRVNIYAEEMTDRVEIISKEIDGAVYTGLRLYLELPVTQPHPSCTEALQQIKGPFIHRPGDDDSAAITFWGKRDLRVILRIMLEKIEAHYSQL